MISVNQSPRDIKAESGSSTHTFDASRLAFASSSLSSSALVETLMSTVDVLLIPDRGKPKVMLLAENGQAKNRRRSLVHTVAQYQSGVG